MYRHGPSSLAGPVSRARPWWVGSDLDRPAADAGPATTSLADSDDIRVDLVDRIRREIAAGTYDTDEKLQQALDALFDRLD